MARQEEYFTNCCGIHFRHVFNGIFWLWTTRRMRELGTKLFFAECWWRG